LKEVEKDCYYQIDCYIFVENLLNIITFAEVFLYDQYFNTK